MVPISELQPKRTDGWYYLPAFPNYAPKGLPDFDQRQDHWMSETGIWFFLRGVWSFCAPTSLSDILWWFDSKHEDPQGVPGDGKDDYPLVRDYHAPGTPDPGPFSDDHNFNNVNDPLSSWNLGQGQKELIESVAWYCNTNFCRFRIIPGFSGTYPRSLEQGAKRWIKDAGLQDHYKVEALWNPSFSTICDRLLHNDGVIVDLLFYNPKGILIHKYVGHYVAVAGINPEGSIAFSDPIQNKMNPGPTPADHNDASAVSYDIYQVNLTSPLPKIASWYVEDFMQIGPIHFDGLAKFALVISETS